MSEINPQVGASTDDTLVDATTIYNTHDSYGAGKGAGGGVYSSGARFTGVTIPNGAIISTAYLIMKSNGAYSGTTCKVRYQGEQNNAAAAFSTLVDFTGRTKTTAYMDDDDVATWADNAVKNSSELKTIIQELVDDYSGLTDAEIVIFMLDNGSSTGAIRLADSWDGSAGDAPILHIEYTVTSTYTQTVSMDTLLQATDSKTVDLDVLVQDTDSKTIDVDALLERIDSKTITISSLLKALGITETIDLDALTEATDTTTVALDVILGISRVQIALDALLRDADSKSADLDALIQKADSQTVTLDALLSILDTKDVLIDTLLERVDAKTIDISALLRDADSKSVDLDTLIQALGSQGVDLDALIEALDILTIDVDALLRGEVEETVDLDAFIRASGVIESIDLDALVAVLDIPRTVLLDAILLGTSIRDVDLDVLLRDGDSVDIALDAFVEYFSERSITLDAILIRKLPPEQIYTVEIRNTSGDLISILEHAHFVNYTMLVNQPHLLKFTIPATDTKAVDVKITNEFWLRNNETGDVVRKFRLQGRSDSR